MARRGDGGAHLADTLAGERRRQEGLRLAVRAELDWVKAVRERARLEPRLERPLGRRDGELVLEHQRRDLLGLQREEVKANGGRSNFRRRLGGVVVDRDDRVGVLEGLLGAACRRRRWGGQRSDRQLRASNG